MQIYLKNNRAKLYPDLIWNDRVLGFFEHSHPNSKNTNSNTSNMGSVPDPPDP